MGKKTHKTALSPWDFVTLPEDRATAIGNMHRKIGKDPTWSCADILADRQAGRQAGSRPADRQTDRQADRQTDVLITILCHQSYRRSNNTTQIRI